MEFIVEQRFSNSIVAVYLSNEMILVQGVVLTSESNTVIRRSRKVLVLRLLPHLRFSGQDCQPAGFI